MMFYTLYYRSPITLWKSSDPTTNFTAAKSYPVWTPPPNTNYSNEVWAPELHDIRGTWYIYFTARGT